MKRLALVIAGVGACSAAPPVFAQPTPEPTRRAAEAAKSADDEADIVVTGQRLPGSVIGDIPPEVTFNQGDIRSFGVSSLNFVVSAITVDGIDTVAAAHDLTLVATGRGGLSGLFPVDESRTVYYSPQRTLLMLTVTGLGHGPDVFAHRSAVGGEHNTFAVSGNTPFSPKSSFC